MPALTLPIFALAATSAVAAQQADAPAIDPLPAPPVAAPTIIKTVDLGELQAIARARNHQIIESSTDPRDIWVNAVTEGNLRYTLSATDCQHRDEPGCHAMLITITYENAENDIPLDRINKANLAVPGVQVWIDRARNNVVGFSRLATMHGGRTRDELMIELDLLMADFWFAHDEVWPDRAGAK